MTNIYEELKNAGVEIANHESDLYCPVNVITKEIVSRYEYSQNVTIFKDQITGKPWYNIPFAYTPFWENKKEE